MFQSSRVWNPFYTPAEADVSWPWLSDPKTELLVTCPMENIYQIWTQYDTNKKTCILTGGLINDVVSR